MQDLKQAGLDVDATAITIEEAKNSILKALGKNIIIIILTLSGEVFHTFK